MRFPKLGVPKPVTGSQPSAAYQPIPSCWMSLLPLVMSVKAAALLYKRGFKNPRVLSFWRRTLLRRVTIPAKDGVEQEVPPTSSHWPPLMMLRK